MHPGSTHEPDHIYKKRIENMTAWTDKNEQERLNAAVERIDKPSIVSNGDCLRQVRHISTGRSRT